MSDDSETVALLRAIAEEEGKSLDEVVGEFLKLRADRRLMPQQAGAGLTGAEAIARRAPAPVVERRAPPPARPPRYAPDPLDQEESDREAMERWLEEERNEIGGVLGPGGMSAGGIFGEGVVATESYDPMAEQRMERRAGVALQQRLVRVLEELESHQAERLPGRDPRRLPRGRR